MCGVSCNPTATIFSRICTSIWICFLWLSQEVWCILLLQEYAMTHLFLKPVFGTPACYSSFLLLLITRSALQLDLKIGVHRSFLVSAMLKSESCLKINNLTWADVSPLDKFPKSLSTFILLLSRTVPLFLNYFLLFFFSVQNSTSSMSLVRFIMNCLRFKMKLKPVQNRFYFD